jgi:hypothetical protein
LTYHYHHFFHITAVRVTSTYLGKVVRKPKSKHRSYVTSTVKLPALRIFDLRTLHIVFHVISDRDFVEAAAVTPNFPKENGNFHSDDQYVSAVFPEIID